MITKIQGEAPFQVLTNNFSISPSQEGYTLQISADGVNYSNLFSVGANVTRLVTGVAANSYYRLLGNASEVSINWMKTCVTEGGGDGDMSNYYTKDETDAEISAATSPIQEQLDDVERVTASALTELHNDILDLSGATPTNSPIIPAINTQAEYEAISGDVKTGDLIEVEGVDINGDGNPVSGLFVADVQEEEYEGVVRKSIVWERRDSADSVLLSYNVYPWMAENGIMPIEFLGDTFLISSDMTTEGEEAYNGIGFDGDGKPVITHIAPAYDDETGEITGITREDANIVKSTSVSTIWRGTQAEYDAIATPDASTLYIIINN